jgi:hypothetical protein
MVIPFNHILILDQDFEIHSLVEVCNKIKFPLSQIYIFGSKFKKTYYKKYLFPYWRIYNISTFLDKNKTTLQLTGKFFVIVKDFLAFLQFSDYINNISLLSLKTTSFDRAYVFNQLSKYGFKCKIVESEKSLWVKSFQ